MISILTALGVRESGRTGRPFHYSTSVTNAGNTLRPCTDFTTNVAQHCTVSHLVCCESRTKAPLHDDFSRDTTRIANKFTRSEVFLFIRVNFRSGLFQYSLLYCIPCRFTALQRTLSRLQKRVWSSVFY